MKVLTAGHRYALSDFEPAPPDVASQTLQFIEKRVTGEGEPAVAGQLVTVKNGTTNEDVLKVLINRLQFLQATNPCRENSIVITKLEESLMWLEKRTNDRKARNVEGTPAK